LLIVIIDIYELKKLSYCIERVEVVLEFLHATYLAGLKKICKKKNLQA